MSPRRNWDCPNPSPASECALPPHPPDQRGAYSLAAKGVGESRFRRPWRKSLALCLLCALHEWQQEVYGQFKSQDHCLVNCRELTLTTPPDIRTEVSLSWTHDHFPPPCPPPPTLGWGGKWGGGGSTWKYYIILEFLRKWMWENCFSSHRKYISWNWNVVKA